MTDTPNSKLPTAYAVWIRGKGWLRPFANTDIFTTLDKRVAHSMRKMYGSFWQAKVVECSPSQVTVDLETLFLRRERELNLIGNLISKIRTKLSKK